MRNVVDLQGYLGLRAQDLQEAKDQLLVETSDMLRVPLFTAEALLRNHGKLSASWTRFPFVNLRKVSSTLLIKKIKDPRLNI